MSYSIKRFVCLFFILNIHPFVLPAQTTKPNVILIYTDDVGYGDISCYGATAIKTPNIDKLAESGIRFTNLHCAASTCTPSRYSLITGEYAWRKKGTGILPGNAALILPVDKKNLPKVFQQAGYKTAMVGKWHLGLGPDGGPDWNGNITPGPNEVGFDYAYYFAATADRVPTVFIENNKVVGWNADDPIKVSYEGKIGNEPTGKENPELLKLKALPGQGHDNTIINGIGRIGFMSGGIQARWVDEELGYSFTNKANAFIRENKSNPFFLYLSLNDIHAPRMPGTAFRGLSPLGLRGEMILQMDFTVGAIMDEVERLGLKNNTLIIFTSDNGPALLDGYQDDAGSLAKAAGHIPTGPMRGGKYGILEGATRVPMIVSWPNKIKPGNSAALMSQLDFVRSFEHFFNQPSGHEYAMDSEDQSKALFGKSPTGRTSLVEQGGTLALVWNDWKYIEPSKGAAILMPMNIESGFSQQVQLYHLKEDIAERNNVAEKYPDIVKKLADMLQMEKDKTK